MAKKDRTKPEEVHDAPAADTEVPILPTAPANIDPKVEPKAEPAVQPAAKPVAPAPRVSLCVSCERSCKSTLMCVDLCGKFLPKLRP